jgi:hypothetical protein
MSAKMPEPMGRWRRRQWVTVVVSVMFALGLFGWYWLRPWTDGPLDGPIDSVAAVQIDLAGNDIAWGYVTVHNVTDDMITLRSARLVPDAMNESLRAPVWVFGPEARKRAQVGGFTAQLPLEGSLANVRRDRLDGWVLQPGRGGEADLSTEATLIALIKAPTSQVRIDGMEVTYQVGIRTYRKVFPPALVLCGKGAAPAGCPNTEPNPVSS